MSDRQAGTVQEEDVQEEDVQENDVRDDDVQENATVDTEAIAPAEEPAEAEAVEPAEAEPAEAEPAEAEPTEEGAEPEDADGGGGSSDDDEDEEPVDRDRPLTERQQATVREIEATIEAIFFVAHDPVSRQRLLGNYEGRKRELAALALDAVVERYREEPNRGVMIDEVAGGLRLVTRPDLHDSLRRFFESSSKNKLTMPALETLAIIAYRQPVTVPEVQELRGVASMGVVKTLLERRMIRVAGRKEVVGKPFLYATTREFLMHFGLKSLKDLPPLEQFEELFGEELELASGMEPELDPEEIVDREAADLVEADDDKASEAEVDAIDEERKQAEAAEAAKAEPEPEADEPEAAEPEAVEEEPEAEPEAAEPEAAEPEAVVEEPEAVVEEPEPEPASEAVEEPEPEPAPEAVEPEAVEEEPEPEPEAAAEPEPKAEAEAEPEAEPEAEAEPAPLVELVPEDVEDNKEPNDE